MTSPFKSKWLILTLILFVFLILNPSEQNFKEYKGLTTSSNIEKKFNFLICSIYKYDSRVTYLGILKNFIKINEKKKEQPLALATTDTAKTFPIIELLQNDADDVQKTPYYLYKITSTGKDKKTKDSTVFSREDFAKTIAPLLAIKIGKGQYKEVAFHDLTTKSYSIINTAIDESLEVKSITTLLNDETNKLKNIFIITEKKSSDSTIKTNYYWKATKSLTIVTTTQYKNGTTKEASQYINWNDRD